MSVTNWQKLKVGAQASGSFRPNRGRASIAHPNSPANASTRNIFGYPAVHREEFHVSRDRTTVFPWLRPAFDAVPDLLLLLFQSSRIRKTQSVAPSAMPAAVRQPETRFDECGE